MLARESQAECNKWEFFLPGLCLSGADGWCPCGGEGFGWACWWSRTLLVLPVLPLALPHDLGHRAPTAQCSCASVDPPLPCSSGIGTARSCSVGSWVRCCTSALWAHAHSDGCELLSCPAFCTGCLWWPSQALPGPPQGRGRAVEPRGWGFVLSSLSSCGVGDAAVRHCKPPATFTPVCGWSRRRGESSLYVFLYQVSFGKCHCSSACPASEGVEGGASDPCPHPKGQQSGFLCGDAAS